MSDSKFEKKKNGTGKDHKHIHYRKTRTPQEDNSAGKDKELCSPTNICIVTDLLKALLDSYRRDRVLTWYPSRMT
jgi:hypothetical protein